MERFFTLLRFVQNDRVLVCSHGLKIRAIGMRYEMRVFLSQSSNDCVFEHTEEHRRCSGKCTRFLKRKDFFYFLYVFKGAKLAKFIHIMILFFLAAVFINQKGKSEKSSFE